MTPAGWRPGKPEGAARLEEGISLLADYQAQLWTQGNYGVILILQGLDASGKDSTIKQVMPGSNRRG